MDNYATFKVYLESYDVQQITVKTENLEKRTALYRMLIGKMIPTAYIFEKLLILEKHFETEIQNAVQDWMVEDILNEEILSDGNIYVSDTNQQDLESLKNIIRSHFFFSNSTNINNAKELLKLTILQKQEDRDKKEIMEQISQSLEYQRVRKSIRNMGRPVMDPSILYQTYQKYYKWYFSERDSVLMQVIASSDSQYIDSLSKIINSPSKSIWVIF